VFLSAITCNSNSLHLQCVGRVRSDFEKDDDDDDEQEEEEGDEDEDEDEDDDKDGY
jgi:hypothetical protein